MGNPMRIRALQKGEVTAITVIVAHPMETGLRKDAAGQPVPAHFIQQLSVDVAGKRVVDSHINTAISANPVFNFKVKGVKVGDKVVVSWVDNKGDKRTDEAAITP